MPKLREAVFNFLYPLLVKQESRQEALELLPRSFQDIYSIPERVVTTVKRNIRGKHSDLLAIRIMRYARWMDGAKNRLGGWSPRTSCT